MTIDQQLGYSEADFWSPEREGGSGLGPWLLRQRHKGLAVGAPRRVHIDRRTTLPAFACVSGPSTLCRRYDLGTGGVVVAVEPRRGDVRVASLIDEGVEPAEGIDDDDDPDDPDAASAESASASPVELRERLALPWRPGRWLLTVLGGDLASNRAEVELRRDREAYDDPAVDALIDAEFERMSAPQVWPPPSPDEAVYTELPTSLPIPSGRGISLLAERATVLRAGARAALTGSWRLPVLARHRVRLGHPVTPPGYPNPNAVVDITIVALGVQTTGPVVLRLRVPSWDPLPANGAPAEATGRFRIDLLALREMLRVPQTYFLYAFASEVMAGPVRLSLVDPTLLPAGE